MIISFLDLLPSIIIKVHNIKKLGMPRTAWTGVNIFKSGLASERRELKRALA